MLNKIIRRFIIPRHYWRDLGFDELSELYTAMMFRSLAMSLVGIFIPIYLFMQGYEVWQIFYFYTVYFSIWAIVHFPVAHIVAKVGPKHTILASYVFQAIGMLMLVSLADLKWPLAAIGAILGISNCLYFVAFHVDFSKIKHSKHGGKEVGWMYSMQQIGAVLGPIVGGAVGYIWGGEYIFMAAVILLFTGIIPLFITSEPTATNQKLKFDKLDAGQIKSDLITYGGFHIDHLVSVILWPMFISIYIFDGNPYVQLGSVISVSVLLSVFVARIIGRRIDKNRGREMLRGGAIANAVIHLLRPFTGGYSHAMGLSMLNEVVTPTYRMPYTKGMYDAADDLPGRRIVYITAMEATGSISKATLSGAACLLAIITGGSKHIFTVIFIVGAIASLVIMSEQFRALNVKK